MATTRVRTPVDPRILARRRAVRVAAVRRRRRVAWSLAAVAALALGLAALARSPLFAITDVAVTGVSGDQATAVTAAAGVAIGDNLLDADLDGIAERVGALPWVAGVQVSRQPPSTVALAVDARHPTAVLRVGDALWLVDADGVLVQGGSAPGLPVIVAPRAVLPGVGQPVSDVAVRNALAVDLALPPAFRARVDRYDAPSEAGLRLHLEAEDVWVRIGRAEEVAAKADVVDALLATARSQGGSRGVAELDVRAPSNPVLVPD